MLFDVIQGQACLSGTLPYDAGRAILLRLYQRSGGMLPDDRLGRLVRFGTFEADLTSRELFNNGLKVRLTEQPFQLLAILLEHPGEVVPRDDLRRRLWAEDTFV